jgi:hypothetical protein
MRDTRFQPALARDEGFFLLAVADDNMIHQILKRIENL